MAFPNPKWSASGKQIILKEDLLAIENAIGTQGLVRMQPPLVYVGATSVKVAATADCEIAMQFTGMPNILNPQVQVSGGLSDGNIRTITAPVTCDLTNASDLWGAEQVSQWYAVFALAEDADTDFTLHAMPFMRVKTEAAGVIHLGTLAAPGTSIGYTLTEDELAGGKVYVLFAADPTQIGLMREITNNNDSAADSTITYTGAALTLAEGDWLMVLPSHKPGEITPTINFRFVGTIFNQSTGNIEPFIRIGNEVYRLSYDDAITFSATIVEDIKFACPLACSIIANVTGASGVAGDGWVGHPSSTYTYRQARYFVGTSEEVQTSSGIEFCRVYAYSATHTPVMNPLRYSYPPGCGY